MRLFELVAQHKSLEWLMESEEELPPEVLRDTLEGLEGEIEQKMRSMAYCVLNLQADADAILAAANKMYLRRDRVQKRAESLKQFLLWQMQTLNIERIDATDIVIRRQANPPSVYIADENAIPAEYWRQPPAPPPQLDKLLIKAALQNGEDVPGAFIESGEHLRIAI
jgi:hypothetical protein